jgi:hypothetical protein
MRASSDSLGAPRRAQPLWWAALVAVLIFYAWAEVENRFMLYNVWGDTWAHLALIRRTMERGWFPGDAFYPDTPTPPYYCLMHLLLAAACALTGWPPHELWLMLGPVLAVASVAAMFAWLRALTGDVRVAVIGAATELLISRPDPTWWAMPLPRTFAIAPGALACLAYLRGRQRNERPYLVAAAFLLGLTLALHLFVGGFTMASLLLLELALRSGGSRSGVRVYALTAAGALLLPAPWIANVINGWRLRSASVARVFETTPEAWSFTLGPLTARIYRPAAALDTVPSGIWLLVVFGLAVCAIRLVRGQATAADRFALYSSFATVVLMFTPLYGALLLVAGIWAERVVQVVPFALLAGTGWVTFADWIRAQPRGGRVAGTLIGAVAAIWITWNAVSAVTTLLEQSRGLRWWLSVGPLGNWNLAGQLGQSGPLPRVLLSDPWTSYVLPYYIGQMVVVMPAAHGSAYVDHTSREGDARRAFNPRTSITELRAVLDKYQVDAVAIAPSSGWPAPGAPEALLNRLRRHPAFEDTGCCSTALYVLRYHG